MRRGLVLLLVASGACTAGDEDTPDDSDAGGTTPRFEVRIGTGHEWTAFADGDTLWLQRGNQGAQHVLVSVRAWPTVDEVFDVDVRFVRERDDEVVSLPYVRRLPWEVFVEDRGEMTGMTPVVADPTDIVGEDITIEVDLVDALGQRAEIRRRAAIVWGPDDDEPHN